MPSRRSLGTLTIDMVANIAGWKEGMTAAERQAEKTRKQIEREQERLAKSIAETFAAAAAATATTLASLSAIVVKTSADILNLADQADRVSMPIEQFSGYAAAAKDADIGVDGFSRGLERLNNAVSKAQSGNASARGIFESLGIDPDSIRDTEDGMRKVSEALNSFADDANKSALAQELFGRNAAGMMRFLNQGTAAIDEQVEAHRALGNVIDENARTRLAQYDAATKQLRGTLDGMSKQITVATVPAFTAITEAITDLTSEKGSDFQQFFEGVEVILAGVVKVALGAASVITMLGKSIAAVVAIATNPRSARTIFEQWKKDISDTALSFGDAMDKIDKRYKESPLSKPSEREESNRPSINRSPTGNDTAQTTAKTTDALAQLRSQVTSMTDALERGQGAQARYEQTVRKLGEAMEEAIAKGGNAEEARRLFQTGVEAANQTLEDELAKLDQARQKDLEAIASRYEGAIKGMTQAELEFQRVLEDAQTLLSNNIINFEEYMRIMDEAGAKLDESNAKHEKNNEFLEEMAKQGARNIQDAMAQFLFDPFQGGLKGMVQGFADALRQMAAQAAAQDIFKRLMGGIGGMGGIGESIAGFFGGGRASGGSIESGKAYLVGERGPELIFSNSKGFVANAEQTRGMLSGGTTQVFNVTTPDPDAFRASQRQIMRQAKQAMA